MAARKTKKTAKTNRSARANKTGGRARVARSIRAIRAIRATHDALFRKTVEDMDACAALLRIGVSKEKIALFDLGTLRLEPSLFVGDDLAESRADVVVSVKFKGSAKRAGIVFLLEHKSRRDRRFPLQVLGYHTGIYLSEAYRRRRTPVWTVLVHQGKAPWKGAPLNFQDSELADFPPEARALLRRHFIDFTCSFVDIQDIDILREVKDPVAMTVLFAMQKVWTMDDDLYGKIIKMAKPLRWKRKALVQALWCYIGRYATRYTDKDVIDAIEKKVIRRKEDRYVGRMFGELTREERTQAVKEGEKKGEKRGEKRGAEKTMERTALRMLKGGEGVEKVRRYTGLPRARIETLRRSVLKKVPA